MRLFILLIIGIISTLALYFYIIHPPEDQFLLGGIQINEPNQNDWMKCLKRNGMNTVSVTTYARQGIWNSDNIWWDKEDEGIIKEIKAAKRKKVNVVLIPRILLDHWFQENHFLWHGMTMPANDSLLISWFDGYDSFLEKWAKVAEKQKVKVMAIGSEMRALSATLAVKEIPSLEAYYLNNESQEIYLEKYLSFQDEIEIKDLWVRGADNYERLEDYKRNEVAANVAWAKQLAFDGSEHPVSLINDRRQLLDSLWRNTIKKVRKHFSGQLTYAANFDNYQNVSFWDDLDFIGINAYFKLRNWDIDSTQTDIYPELVNSWKTIFNDIVAFQDSQRIDKPVLFTELGYIYRENCTLMPWEGHGFSILETADYQNQQLMIWQEQKENLQERALAIRALNEVHLQYEENPILKGILYWKLTTKDYHLPYEPFALDIEAQPVDPMLVELRKFLK